MRVARLTALLLALAWPFVAAAQAAVDGGDAPADWAARFEREVDRRLQPPLDEQAHYAERLQRALAAAHVRIERAQFVLLVDRSAFVQAILLWWVGADARPAFVGASPVSSGRPSGFDHFETPLGAFEHSLANPDFRAEGTRNVQGVRGYGDRGMRVYDFGWVLARRGWAPGEQLMRLQMHATDRALLEPRLGQRASKGCIRIPHALNLFIDRHGVLDAAYDEALAQGRGQWVLRPGHVPNPWAGRWLVVIDSERTERAAWAPVLQPRTGRVPAAAAASTPASAAAR